MNTTTHHIPRIDILRAVAIFLVFCSHFPIPVISCSAWHWQGLLYVWNDSPGLFTRAARLMFFDGHRGVVLFFVVSGLCIRLSHRSTNTFSTTHFYWRRFWRIYPPYLTALCLFVFLQSFFQKISPFDFISHLLLAHNFSTAWYGSINSPFWSLALEFQVYLLYPVLLLMHRKWGVKYTLAFLAVLSVVSESLAGDTVRHFLHLPDVFQLARQMPTILWPAWYAGFLVADGIVDNKPQGKYSLPLLLLGAALIPLVKFFRPFTPFNEVVNAVVVALLVDLFLRCRLPDSKVFAWLGWIGVSSYSFYLYFDQLIRLVAYGLGNAGLSLQLWPVALPAFALVFLLVAAFSYGAYRFIEMPSIALGRSLYRRLQKS